jgi:hypothetical protein
LASLPAFGTCCIVQTLTPSSSVLLSAGARYWIVASAGTPDAWVGWNLNNLGVSGLVELNNGAGFFIPPQPELGAFDVLGEVRTAVPEPATGLISAVGLMLLGRRRAQMRGGA